MDAAEEVDQDHAGSCFLHLASAEYPVGKKETQTGAGIGNQHEECRVAHCLNLLISDRSENTMVQCIVEEKDLGGLYEDRRERQRIVGDDPVDAVGKDRCHGMHDRSEYQISEAAEDRADDTERKVIDDHLESAGDLSIYRMVKLSDDQAGKRSEDHGSHEHRSSFNCYDRTYSDECTQNTAPVVADHLTAGIGDQHWQQIVQDR